MTNEQHLNRNALKTEVYLTIDESRGKDAMWYNDKEIVAFTCQTITIDAYPNTTRRLKFKTLWSPML